MVKVDKVIGEILLFQIIAIVLTVLSLWWTDKKNLWNVIISVLYMFFVLFAPYLTGKSKVYHEQKVFCIALYIIVLVGGIVLNFYIAEEHNFIRFYAKKEPACEQEDEVQIEDNGAKITYLFFLFICTIFYILLNGIAIISYFHNQNLCTFLNKACEILMQTSFYVYGVIIISLFVLLEGCRRQEYYKTTIIVFSVGVLLFSLIIETLGVIELPFVVRWLIYANIVMYYLIGCIATKRTRVSIFFRCILIIMGGILLLCNLRNIIFDNIAMYYQEYHKEVFIGLCVLLIIMAFGLFPLTSYYIPSYREEIKNKFATMFILNKKSASKIEGVNSEGTYYKGEEILGFYCVKWTYRSVTSFAGINKMIEIEKSIGKDPTELLDEVWWDYILETNGGWYYSFMEQPFRNWESCEKGWQHEKSMHVPVKLFILNEKELDMLDEKSYFVKMYRKKYKGRYHLPIKLQNKALR